MSNKEIHWFEAKQLDRVTNFSTEVEIIKAAVGRGVLMKYYCTFKKSKVYFGLEGNIRYLGRLNNRYLKSMEFQLLVIFRSLKLIISGSNRVVIVNQDLIGHVLPALFLNKLLRKNNRFVVDIRTTPTDPNTFEKDMVQFHRSFKRTVKHFHGLSFITPFMEKLIMSKYSKQIPTVNWSSGVDVELFDPGKYSKKELNETFTIFYHGGISESRGNLDLIKACEKLVNSSYNIQLVQIGICVDHSIPNYIAEKQLESWCKLLPAVPLNEIPDFVLNSDLPVLPFPDFMAWRVSSPIKLMEYLAMGKKVLAPNMEAFTDVFDNHPELVFYFDTNKEDAAAEMSEKIAGIIDNKRLDEVNKQACIDFVSSRYTWKQQADYLIQFCIDL